MSGWGLGDIQDRAIGGQHKAREIEKNVCNRGYGASLGGTLCNTSKMYA